ncbi:MAG: hypothetical protein WBX15_08700 [Thermoanaerobaculia bacterium]
MCIDRRTAILIVFVALITFPLFSSAAETEVSLTAADRAFAAHDIGRAAVLYRSVAASEAGDDRAKAQLRLALLEWRYYGNDDHAQALLHGVIREGKKSSDAWAMISRLEDARGRFATARDAALRALLHADLESRARSARLLWAAAAMHEIEKIPLPPDAGPEIGEELEPVLKALVDDQPGELESSRLLLRAALLNHDGPAALEAWRSYYRVPPGGEPYNLMRPSYGTLVKILPGWDGSNPEVNAKLVGALGASRFFHDASLVASRYEIPESAREDLAPLLAYADLIEAIEPLTNEYYRKLAIGRGDGPAWLHSLMGELVARWDSLQLPGKAPVVPPGADVASFKKLLETTGPIVNQALGARYGAYLNVGITAGYLDLHLGHEVSDTDQSVEQYGHEVKVRLIVLDDMVSNGFESWAWDFRSQHGGWAKPNAIYQVRAAYANGPVNSWNRLTDPDQRRKWDEEIARDSSADDAIARKDPHAFLPGLRGRLERASLESVRSDLQSQGLKNADLRTAFLRKVEDATRGSSIFAHEGRHVIDKELGIKSNEELEYRAKLSEIAFAELPRLALSGGILHPNLGDQTPHGQANLRVIRDLVSWMDHHRSEIAGLDSGRPLLPQLDLLTPDQLRAAARAADPLARAGKEETAGR